ncbi:DUF262 domain-containing protein [Acidithiobacillus ferrivorans]|nr:DUF262 domain-containing protein [Acidithiobacillus ferrivorans]
MKSFDSRAYSINDFVEWDKQKQLQLNPAFQRRPVWSDKAKSYLLDTIIRGKPIPKIFIRQKINVTTKTSLREVVDGQQRLRSILSYIKDGFVISKSQNSEYGGLRFSQLSEDVQAQVLSYEISVDLLINLPDAEILDIFSRLNSYAVVLNEQERINATHFSSFKILADSLGRKYYDYWTTQGIISSRNILRMQEVNLVADLLIAMREGIKAKKQIKKYYDQYENNFIDNPDEIENKFDNTIRLIANIFPEGLSNTEFSRPHLFYSIFTAVAHCLYGIPGIDASKKVNLVDGRSIENARNGLDRVGELFESKDVSGFSDADMHFIEDSRRATTDGIVRKRRCQYLLDLMV